MKDYAPGCIPQTIVVKDVDGFQPEAAIQKLLQVRLLIDGLVNQTKITRKIRIQNNDAYHNRVPQLEKTLINSHLNK